MVEVSEMERKRRKAARDADDSQVNRALSFRLGTEHVLKLRQLAKRTDIHQAKILRKLIDGEHERVFKGKEPPVI